MPWPNDCKTEILIILKAAKGKLMLMIFSAGTPMASMDSEALNSPSSSFGHNWKITSPMVSIQKA